MILLFSWLSHIIIYWGWVYNSVGIPSSASLHETVKLVESVIVAQVILFPLCGAAFWWVRGTVQSSSWPLTLVKVIGCYCWTDLTFYWIHRALHLPALYWIHKKHHRHVKTIPWHSLDASIVENLCLNILPIFTAPLVVGLSDWGVYWWVVAATISTLTAHKWVGDGDPTTHGIHHRLLNCNYGIIGLTDWLFDTTRQSI